MNSDTLLGFGRKCSLRTLADKKFTKDHALRKLSATIAGLGRSDAAQNGFTSAQPPPYNLLANAELEADWTPPTTSVPEGLMAWKAQLNGFRGFGVKGLSMLFDPFVDATLLMYAHHNGEEFKNTTVLVLTDYGPLLHFVGELIACQGSDWAANCVLQFLKAENLGAPGINIVKATCGAESIETIRKSDGVLEKSFAAKRLLIWNYFPFFRGGTSAEGCAGLPNPIKRLDWLKACDCYLDSFLMAVKADNLVWACNKEVQEARRSLALAHELHGIVKAMKHPCRWTGEDRRGFSKFLQS